MNGPLEAKDQIALEAPAMPAKTVRIAIFPAVGAWMVEASFNDGPLAFQTRQAAGRTAQKLAQAAAAAGWPVELHIHPDE